jgi:hypothetical protein
MRIMVRFFLQPTHSTICIYTSEEDYVSFRIYSFSLVPMSSSGQRIMTTVIFPEIFLQ